MKTMSNTNEPKPRRAAMITLIANNEEDQKIGQRHAVNVVEKYTEAADGGLSVWRDSYTEAGKLRKRPWAVGCIKRSTFLGCCIPIAHSHHGTIEAAIAQAKSPRSR